MTAQTRLRMANLSDLGLQTVKELETEQGILASGRGELYGCIFGRDSLITSLRLLQVYQMTGAEDCIRIVKKSLETLANLQGKVINIESGEEPGKVIHEYRPENHEHLTGRSAEAWYVYPDLVMRNYDTIDATPLFLITAYRYLQATGDSRLISHILPNIKKALEWILLYSDTTGDGLLDYALKPGRQHGGLKNQNWMDSKEAAFHEDGIPVTYPLAPAEAQAYAYLALRLWATYFDVSDLQLSSSLVKRARHLKDRFNESYVLLQDGSAYLAAYIDAAGRPLKSVRSTMGHCLWASLTVAQDGELDGIVADKYIRPIAKRLLKPDMFEPKAGIRTLSTKSKYFQANSYHNGSIWPHDTSIVAQGLTNYGFTHQATKVRQALLTAMSHFNTPIELFVFWNNEYADYTSISGQTACKKQAWSAASILVDTIILAKQKKSIMSPIGTMINLVKLFNEVKLLEVRNNFQVGLEKLVQKLPNIGKKNV